MPTLIDTSVWIDLLGSAKRHRLSAEQLPEVVTCPPVIQEVLQGIKHDSLRQKIRERFLALVRVGDPMDVDLHLSAAELYVTGRQRGLAIRSSVDCLIAAIALKHGLTVWHADRDFDAIARFTPLKVRRGVTLDEAV